MTGKQQTEHSWPRSAGSVKTANELNAFYAFFTVKGFWRGPCFAVSDRSGRAARSFRGFSCHQLSSNELAQRIRPRWADTELELKNYAIHLYFSTLLNSQITMPHAWKPSRIVPVPRKCIPQQLNEFRSTLMLSSAL